jgi:hypothetical protein
MADQICDVTGCLEKAVWVAKRRDETIALCSAHFVYEGRRAERYGLGRAERGVILALAAIADEPDDTDERWTWDSDPADFPPGDDPDEVESR